MAMKHKSYYKLAHKRENMRDYKWNVIAYDPFRILEYKIRLERRLKICYNSL